MKVLKPHFPLYFFISCYLINVYSIKYNTDFLNELSLLTKEGKELWDSITEKVSVPRYGSCWKNAVSNLRVGCKFLSENIQSDLALKFTDCFLQMSGFEPMTCFAPKEMCLQQLSDRAFNAYTEFYTHTQSICYFLQNQVWHEETQKTIDKLSGTSLKVSAQLEESGLRQERILKQQKESLQLQHHLIDNAKIVASALESSEVKISEIMKSFQDSAAEQKKALLELFDKISLLRSWALGEMSWINSMLFYMSSMIIGYLFTSVPSTKEARLYVFILLSLNYCLERYLCSFGDHETDFDYNVWIWWLRKGFLAVSAIILIYSVMAYCDYNIMNHKLLLEIKTQNTKILHNFNKNSSHFGVRNSYSEYLSSDMKFPKIFSVNEDRTLKSHYVGRSIFGKNLTCSPVLCKTSSKTGDFYDKRRINIDDIDNSSLIMENSRTKSQVRVSSHRTPYNLRSSNTKK